MATIKAYTDISQSKTLSKILPLESADMHFVNDKHAGCVPYLEMTKGSNPWLKGAGVSPCWSLASLLRVLPNNENISTNLSRGGYRLSTLEYTNSWFVDYEDETNGFNNCVTSADNPVDACVAMIEKLHELKML